MLYLVFTKHQSLVFSLNISERCPFPYFDLNMKITLSAVPVSLNNQRLVGSVDNIFSYSSQNKEKGSVH